MRAILRTISIVAFAASLALANDPVEQTGNLTEQASGKTVFEIRGSHNLNGDIKIISGDKIDISYKKSAEAGSQQQAQRFLDLIDLRLVSKDDRVILNILAPSDSPWEGSEYHVSLDIVVQLPEKMKIEGQLQFMTLEIQGLFSGVIIKSTFSGLNISDIDGPIEVSTSFAPIKLSNISGSIKAETRYGAIEARDIRVPLGTAIFKNSGGTINLSNIQGPVEVYTSYSPIEAQDIETADGSLVFMTSYSPIKLNDVSGEIICETSFSPIDISDCKLTHGQSRIETGYSPIKADLSVLEDGQLFIYNNYNNISLTIPTNVSSKITATIDEGGKIHTSSLPIKPTFLDATRLEGTLGGGRGRIELKVSGIGTIEIDSR